MAVVNENLRVKAVVLTWPDYKSVSIQWCRSVRGSVVVKWYVLLSNKSDGLVEVLDW